MSAPARTNRRATRRGITLLEVLISIGILSIGLTSALALLPVARSQSARAVILDRAAALAANVLADAATFGVLRTGTDCFMVPSGATWVPMGVRPGFLVIDAARATLTSGSNVALKNTGLYGSGTTVAPPAFFRSFMQSRDDIVVLSGTGNDPPLNAVADGTRAFDGRMTGLLCLRDLGTGLHLASVVVFYARDPNLVGTGVAAPLITGDLTTGTLTLQTPDLGERSVTDLIRPGVVVNISGTLHQLTAANITVLNSNPSTTTASAFLASAKDPAIGSAGPTTIQFLPDSVGLAERVFTPEAPGAFTQ